MVAGAQRVMGERLRVVEVLPGLAASVVVRMEVEAAASVIVKAARPSNPGSKEMLFNDWAATQLLTRVGGDAPLCARFYGGDPELPLIVLEDLGGGAGSPDRVVEGDDPDAAAAALIDYVRIIAALHVQARDHAEEFTAIRQTLGSIPMPDALYHDPWSDARVHTDTEITAAVGEYLGVLGSLGVTAAPGVEDEIAEVTRRVEDPGPFTSLCQGDQNGLGNCTLSGGRLRLIDFGVAGYRHALIEGLPQRITWGCIRRVPQSVITAMDSAYREAVGGGSGFEQAVTDALARWHIFHVNSRIPDALRGDRPRGAATLRQQVIAWVDAFADRHHEHGSRPALGRTAVSVAGRLRRLWPPETHSIPYFPAFRE